MPLGASFSIVMRQISLFFPFHHSLPMTIQHLIRDHSCTLFLCSSHLPLILYVISFRIQRALVSCSFSFVLDLLSAAHFVSCCATEGTSLSPLLLCTVHACPLPSHCLGQLVVIACTHTHFVSCCATEGTSHPTGHCAESRPPFALLSSMVAAFVRDFTFRHVPHFGQFNASPHCCLLPLG